MRKARARLPGERGFNLTALIAIAAIPALPEGHPAGQP